MNAPTPLQQLLVDATPLIDVRAPVEFSQGAFPSAVNLPILNDEERHQIGICYKEEGPAAAQTLGYQLVSGDVKETRVKAWASLLDEHPEAHLYCFRGGDRSRIACEWLLEAGYNVPRVEGGYKALRREMLGVYDHLPPLVVVSGRTGSGKTLFLKNFSQVIDLEGIANHRGSAFGGFLTPQPSQIGFENEVAVTLLRLRQSEPDQSRILIEDEGRLIGRIHVPEQLQRSLKQSPMLVIEDQVETRASRIKTEYIDEQAEQYVAAYGDSGLDELEKYLLKAVSGIRKRLGGLACDQISYQIVEAMVQQRQTGETDLHLSWIERMLTDYYDPMYDYQLKSHTDRVLARGTHEELLEWCQQNPEFCDE